MSSFLPFANNMAELVGISDCFSQEQVGHISTGTSMGDLDRGRTERDCVVTTAVQPHSPASPGLTMMCPLSLIFPFWFTEYSTPGRPIKRCLLSQFGNFCLSGFLSWGGCFLHCTSNLPPPNPGLMMFPHQLNLWSFTTY